MTIRSTICLTCVGVLALGLVSRPESGMPIETLGSDKAQRQALYQQAKACVNRGKPRQAVVLISQIIKSDPPDAVAYLTNNVGALSNRC